MSAVADEDLQHFANHASQLAEINNGSEGTPGDEKLFVKFESHPHLDDVLSRDSGRPRYVMADYIRIMIPGDKDSVVHRPIRESDKVRFPKQWLRFQANQSQVIGTPLSTWPQISRAQVEELAFFNIRTIEDLANISDGNAQKYIGVSELREKAKAYLQTLADSAPMDTMRAELVSRDEKIAALEAQIAQVLANQTDAKKGK